MRIILGSDHAGYKLKEAIKTYLATKSNYTIKDIGTFSTESVDYPEIGAKVARAVVNKKADRGILICGSGEGMCIVANRFQGIRAALAPTIKHAEVSRRHNNANILCLGGRLTNINEALAIVNIFLITKFENGRYQRRVEQIEKIFKINNE